MFHLWEREVGERETSGRGRADLRMEASFRSDWDLLRAVGHGEADAFQELVERHQERLIRLCERLLQDRDEALDAAQEVFLKVYRKAGSLEPQGELFTWIYRVAVNHCLNRLRRRKLVRFLSLDRSSDEEAAFEPPDRGPDAHDVLAAKRRWKAVRRSIEALPPGQRTVLLLAKLEGLSYRRIAEVLDITVGAVESRLFRAMRRLAAQEEGASLVSLEDES